MKRISFFKVSLLLIIIGSIWISIVFNDGQRMTQEFDISTQQTEIFKFEMTINGIGYYKILIPEFKKNGVFVQILDEKQNIISDKNIETKMSVNYFELKNSGTYTVKISNVAKSSIIGHIEIGETNSENMKISGSIIAIGVILLLITSYYKLKNYSIAHPDENTS